MRVIYKYPFGVSTFLKIEMPESAEILSVQIDNKTGIPCLWAIVDTDKPKINYYFSILGTGETAPISSYSKENHVSTFQEDGFVWHMFIKK